MSAWVVVPKTPRLVMLLNARECNNDDAANAHVYRRMIAARPTGPDVPVVCPVGHTTIDASELEALRRDAERYRELSTPEIADFLAAVEREALHQRDRWAAEHDAGKTDADWFWLIGYLAGKAINKPDKILHHIITTAAACLNWHAAKLGASNVMRPGIAQEKAG